MSGHSKFANIKHKKEKNDAAKGKVFTIIGREIAVAVKEGGPDPNNNSRLRDVIAKAKANNMPNDTIDRGIKRAAGDANAVNYEHVTYEGYGPSGIAIIVEALTDNKNRTASYVRHAFTNGHGSLGVLHGMQCLLFPMAGVITSVPLLLFNKGVKMIPYYLTGILMYVNPTIQFLMGRFYFHEPLEIHRLIAFCFIWGGVGFTIWHNLKEMRK